MDRAPWDGRARPAHPTPEALDALADALPDALADASLVAHVAECATCHAELDQARQVTARLSALAAPPGDLLARVRARRTAGERVLLPAVGGDDAWQPPAEGDDAWHPSAEALDLHAGRTADGEDDAADAEEVASHVAGCAACGAAVDRVRRVTAALSVASAPPPELLARVRARRAAGERVILPAVRSAVAAAEDAPADGTAPEAASPRSPAVRPLRARRRTAALGRWRVASFGAVAALLLVTVRFGPGWRPDAGAGNARGSAGGRPEADPRPRTGLPTPPAPGTSGGPAPAVSSPAPVRGPATSSPIAPRVPDQLRSAPVDEGTPATPDTPSAGGAGSEAGALPASPEAWVRATNGRLSVALAGVPAERFAPAHAEALDSVARVLATDAGRRVTVRYTDPAFAHASPSWEVARRVSDYLELRGIAPDRASLVRVAVLGGFGGRAPADAVEVVVDAQAGPE